MTEESKDGAKIICQVSLNDEEHAYLQHIATRREITVEQWIEEIIRRDMADYRRRSAEIQRALEEATRHNFPTADIEQMLKEIEAGRNRL